MNYNQVVVPGDHVLVIEKQDGVTLLGTKSNLELGKIYQVLDVKIYLGNELISFAENPDVFHRVEFDGKLNFLRVDPDSGEQLNSIRGILRVEGGRYSSVNGYELYVSIDRSTGTREICAVFNSKSKDEVEVMASSFIASEQRRDILLKILSYCGNGWTGELQHIKEMIELNQLELGI